MDEAPNFGALNVARLHAVDALVMMGKGDIAEQFIDGWSNTR
jgi:hypothetical protein